MSRKETKWDELLSQFEEANFLQSELWGDMNEKVGHKVVRKSFDGKAACQMIIKDAKRGRYLEIPGGPLLDWSDENLVRTVFEEIMNVARQHKCAFAVTGITLQECNLAIGDERIPEPVYAFRLDITGSNQF